MAYRARPMGKGGGNGVGVACVEGVWPSERAHPMGSTALPAGGRGLWVGVASAVGANGSGSGLTEWAWPDGVGVVCGEGPYSPMMGTLT